MFGPHSLRNVVTLLLSIGILLQSLDVCRAAKLASANGHPNLFFDQQDVPMLRKKAASTHSFLTETVVKANREILSKTYRYSPPISSSKFTSIWNEVYGNNMPVLGLYVLLFPNDTRSLNATIEYMNKMAHYPSWYVASSPGDEVPLSHSLLGFATTLDFIHQYLSPYQRKVFHDKVANQTELLFKTSKIRWWGRTNLQNHVFTNYLAMFVGALMSRGWREEAQVWITWAKSHLEGNMDALRYIQDGSLHEGVGYGGYSARSLTQYVALAHRHFAINHFNHPWLKKHFDFYYHTTLPGVTKSIGIADTNANWFYGPESQLVFLDRFVMRKGWANYLAKVIRVNRSLDRARSFRYVTLHTEFIWYDADVGEVPPPEWNSSVSHLFQDWGVATLRLGGMMDSKSSAFFMKSGYVFGKALHTRVKKGLTPIESLNAGHEHTDQNTVILSMDGMTVFSDDLYNFKYSHTNNVLLFSPSSLSPCTPGWTGQIGDCRRWNNFLNSKEKLPSGEVDILMTGGHHVFRGEAASAYPDDIRLKCFTRFLVPLGKKLAVLVDYVSLLEQSKVQHVSSFFNNHEGHFISLSHLVGGMEGLGIYKRDSKLKSDLDGKNCEVWWKDHTQQSPKVSLSLVPPSNMSNANITWNLQRRKYSTMAYVISCNQRSIKNFRVIEETGGKFVIAFTLFSGISYSIKLEAKQQQCPSVTKVASQKPGLKSEDLRSPGVTDADLRSAGVPDVKSADLRSPSIPEVLSNFQDEENNRSRSMQSPIKLCYFLKFAIVMMILLLVLRNGKLFWYCNYSTIHSGFSSVFSSNKFRLFSEAMIIASLVYILVCLMLPLWTKQR